MSAIKQECASNESPDQTSQQVFVMTELTIQLDPQQADRLRELARQCGKTPEELVQDNLRQWLADEHTEFVSAANRVLHKNAELYRRLS
jgi:antitoxin FitA